MCTCIHVVDSLCCKEETSTTLESNYTPVKLKANKKKVKHERIKTGMQSNIFHFSKKTSLRGVLEEIYFKPRIWARDCQIKNWQRRRVQDRGGVGVRQSWHFRRSRSLSLIPQGALECKRRLGDLLSENKEAHCVAIERLLGHSRQLPSPAGQEPLWVLTSFDLGVTRYCSPLFQTPTLSSSLTVQNLPGVFQCVKCSSEHCGNKRGKSSYTEVSHLIVI